MKILKKIIITLFVLGISACASFYVVVLSGLFPDIQEVWVTSAMTTFSHQWCATMFISKETIDDIMARTYVDDSGYQTSTKLVNARANEQDNLSIFDFEGDLFSRDRKYLKAGYEKLEEGIFTKEVTGATWHGYLMLVTDPSRVSIADTKRQFVQGETVKSMVKNAGAVAGVNAGGFVDGVNYDSFGEIPSGLLIKNSKVINPKQDTGEIHSVIGFDVNDVLVLGKFTQKQAIENKIRDCIDFRPFLIVNGETVIKQGDGGWGIAPRTAIGQRKTGEVIFLVIDGRQIGYSVGVDLKVLQDVLFQEECINAAMCDGGSSTVMVYNDKFINKPSLGHERYINNAWIIK